MITKYEINDIEKITELGKLLHSNYSFSLNEFEECLVYKNSNNELLGFIIYATIYDRAEIVDIIVKKDYQKKGIGSKLLEKTLTNIFAKDIKNITLEVNETNDNAINLYQKYGFKKVAIRSNYYGEENAILMQYQKEE